MQSTEVQLENILYFKSKGSVSAWKVIKNSPLFPSAVLPSKLTYVLY